MLSVLQKLTRNVTSQAHVSLAVRSASNVSSLNFIERARLQESIRNDNDKCKENLAQGQFLPFYQGKPLLNRSRDLWWQDYDAARAANPRIEEEFVFLGVDKERGVLFAFPADSDLEKGNTEGRFTDMRRALFAVNDLDKG